MLRIRKVSANLTRFPEFMQIYRTKYSDQNLGEEVQLWLELLDLVVFFYYHQTDQILLTTSEHGSGSGAMSSAEVDSALRDRRQHWMLVREETLAIPSQERSIYEGWNCISICTVPETAMDSQPLPTRNLNSMVALFLAVSAKVARSIGQGISGEWADLAAQFMLQAALESCQLQRGCVNDKNPLIYAFAWGWIPPQYWIDYQTNNGDIGVAAEIIINEMFEGSRSGVGQDEEWGNEVWQRARLGALSAFDISITRECPAEERVTAQLQHAAEQYPFHKFERKLMTFLKAVFALFRNPVLVQIEQGYLEGLTADQFQDFKSRVFLPH